MVEARRTRTRTRAVLDVLGARVRGAESRLEEARTALEATEREHAACLACVETESARLRTIVAHLGTPEVSGSAPRYADALAMRDLVARDLERERFVFERAVGERETARAALEERRLALVRLRAREDALRERLAALGREGRRRRERLEETELDELAAARHLRWRAADG